MSWHVPLTMRPKGGFRGDDEMDLDIGGAVPSREKGGEEKKGKEIERSFEELRLFCSRLKELEDVYPPAMFRDVMAATSGRHGPSEPGGGGANVVYVATHVTSALGVDAASDTLGIYSTPEAANVRAMCFFRERYRALLEIWRRDPAWSDPGGTDSLPSARRGSGRDVRRGRGCGYWLEGGCLTLWGGCASGGVVGEFRIFSARREVGTDGFVGYAVEAPVWPGWV
ncbi:hypothetical protein F5Y05DRAFT_414413 [Hypoxylon sp. FL0543]|nr:hypothetical protein F5Y05DRAFT_414413 [Hypoxylon sp. FL0543]